VPLVTMRGFFRALFHHELHFSSGTIPITASRTSAIIIGRPKLCRIRAKNSAGESLARFFTPSGSLNFSRRTCPSGSGTRYFAVAPSGTETRLSRSKSSRQTPSSGFSSVTMPAPRPVMKKHSPASYVSHVSIFSVRSTGLLCGSPKFANWKVRAKLL
jgi:hypothetical protein